MREMKFRAWSSNNKEMIYNVYLYPGNMVVDEDDKVIGHLGIDVYLMQSTGLLDKNRNEIYEGDIVIFEYYCTYIGEVFYNEFFHSCIKVGENKFHIDNATLGEIVGNIYEKPEILNA